MPTPTVVPFECDYFRESRAELEARTLELIVDEKLPSLGRLVAPFAAREMGDRACILCEEAETADDIHLWAKRFWDHRPHDTRSLNGLTLSLYCPDIFDEAQQRSDSGQ